MTQPPFPESWTSEQIENICASCDPTWDEIALMISRGTKCIREEKERLERKQKIEEAKRI